MFNNSESRFWRSQVLILAILFGLNILAWLAVYDLSRARGLEVIFFDVGQGDAILIVGTLRGTSDLRLL